MILNLHRKFFLNKNFNYRLSQDDFNYIKSKFVGFNLNKDKIKTLAIGSSHCENSLIPILFDSCTFNLGLSSLDMFGCYHIYKNNADLPCLKNIFLFYSVFFPGYDLLDTAFHWHSKSIHYRHFFNIPYHDNLIDRDYFQKQIKKLEKNSNKYKINFLTDIFLIILLGNLM